MNLELAAKNQALETAGKKKGDFIQDIVFKKDTIFIECGATIAETPLFDNSNKNLAYKDGQFPNTQFMNRIYSLSCDIDVVFNGTALTNPSIFRRLLNDSYVQLNDSKRMISKIPLARMYKDRIITNPAAVATTARATRADSITGAYTFKKPITVAKNSNFWLKFVPAPGLITAAYDATTTTVYPNSGLGNSASGHAIQFFLECEEYEATV